MTLPKLLLFTLLVLPPPGRIPIQDEGLPDEFDTKFRRELHGWSLGNQKDYTGIAKGMFGLSWTSPADRLSYLIAAVGKCQGMSTAAYVAFDPDRPEDGGLFEMTRRLSPKDRMRLALELQADVGKAALREISSWKAGAEPKTSSEEFRDLMHDMVRTRRPQLLAMTGRGGHSILVTGFKKKGDTVEFSTWDPNEFDESGVHARVSIAYDLQRKRATFQVTRDAGEALPNATRTYNEKYTRFDHVDSDEIRERLRAARELLDDAADGKFDGRIVHGDNAKLLVTDGSNVGGVLLRFDPRAIAEASEDRIAAACDEIEKIAYGSSGRGLIFASDRSRQELQAVSLSQLLQRESSSLGRLTRIRGYIVQDKDILLIGEESASGPWIDLDHLVVALRNTWQHGRFPFVSLDPDPESGRQRVRVGGILDELRETEFVKVLLDADYQMKRIFCGEEPTDLRIPGFRTWFALLCDQRPMQAARSRWWFCPVQSRLSFVWESGQKGTQATLFDSRVQVLTMERVEVGGDILDAERREPVAEEAAELFTRSFDGLAEEFRIFQEMGALFDLVKLCAIWKFKGVRHPLLDELCKLSVKKVALPEAYDGIGPKRVPGTLLAIQGGADTTLRQSALAFRSEERIARMIQARPGDKIAVELPSLILLDETIARHGVAESMVEEARNCLDLEKAEEMFSCALENDPSCTDTYLGRAAARYRQGKLAEALEDVRKAREEIPCLQALEAALLAYLGRREEASVEARKAAEAYSKHPAVLGWAATALLHAHEFAEAERLVGRLEAIAPSSPRAYDLRTLLDLLHHLGPTEGKRRLELVRQVPPTVMNAYDDGVLRMRRFDLVAAAASFELCLGLIERYREHAAIRALHLKERCHLGMAAALSSGIAVYRHIRPNLSKDCAEDGRKHADKIIEVHPDWRTGYFAAILAGLHGGRNVDELTALYDKALAQDPAKDPLHQELTFALGTEKTAAYYGLLLAYKSFGNEKRATSLLEKTLPLLGEGISAEIVRLFLKLRTQRPNAALPELRSLHDRLPDPLPADPVTLWCVGFFYTVLLQVEGKYGDPETHLEKQALKYLRISQISGMHWEPLTQTCAFRLAVASRLSRHYEDLFRGHPKLKEPDGNSPATLRSVREELRLKARTAASPFVTSFIDFGLRRVEKESAENMQAKVSSENDPLELVIGAAETEADLRTASLFVDLLAQGAAAAAAESGEEIPAALRNAVSQAYTKAGRRSLPRPSAAHDWSGWTTAPESPKSSDTPRPPSSKPQSPPRRTVWPFLAGLGAVSVASAGGLVWLRGRRSSVRSRGPKRRK